MTWVSSYVTVIATLTLCCVLRGELRGFYKELSRYTPFSLAIMFSCPREYTSKTCAPATLACALDFGGKSEYCVVRNICRRSVSVAHLVAASSSLLSLTSFYLTIVDVEGYCYMRSHTTTHTPYESSGRVIGPDNIQQSKEININAFGGNRTRNPSK